MKKCLLGLFIFVGLTLVAPIETLAALPTTYTPKINLSTSQRAVWAQMKADYDANPGSPATLGGQMYSRLKTNAECQCRYGDTGLMAAALYQITGDSKYSALSFQAVTNGFLNMSGPSLGGNHAREYFIEYVTIYDWIYNGISIADRQKFFDQINAMATETVTNKYAVNTPIRNVDSDAVVGEYLGLSLWYLLSQNYNPVITNIYSMPFLGGLNATAATKTTLRNSIKFYVEQLAKGGEWIESSEYNTGTVSLLITGTRAIQSLTGVDYFPEVTAFIPDLAKRQLVYGTNDLNHSLQWGDEQNPRAGIKGRLFYHNRTNAQLAGLMKGTAIGAQLQDLVLDLMQKYPPQGNLDNALGQRWIYFFDPYATRGDRTTALMKYYAEGMGTLFFHDGRGNSDSSYFAQTPNGNFVDHMPSYLGNFQLYRKGEWAVTHPIGYGGLTVSGGGGVNGMVIGGIPHVTAKFEQTHNALEQEFGTIGSQEYAYLASAEGGQVQFNGSYQAPPTFMHEHSRSLIYLPSSSKNVDTIVVYDRVNAEDPKTFSGFPSGYSTRIGTRISSQSANKDWYIHMPVVPTITPSTISWATSQNQMKVSTLLPANKTATVINQSIDWSGAGDSDGQAVSASEKKYSVRISPSSFSQWETFLNVVQAGDSGVSTSNTLVKSSGGEAEGVVISRSGLNDVVALFNARPSGNLPKLNGKDNPYNPAVDALVQKAHFTNLGYTATFAVGTSNSGVLISDLDPTASWFITVDGASERSFSVNSNGLGQISLSGAGNHTIALRGVGGNVPTPNPTPTPTPIPTPTPLPTSTKFKAGDRVSVSANLNVRTTASLTGTLLGTQATGVLGTVVSGGTNADGYYWWNVNYDTGVDGWSAENYITKVSLAPTPTPEPVHNTPISAPTPTPEPVHNTPISAPVPTPTPTSPIADSNIVYGTDYVQYTVPSTRAYERFGLSNNGSSLTDSTVDFAFTQSVWGTYKCAAYGASLSCGGSYKPGDVFKISRSGDTITFVKNGEVVQIWTRPSYRSAFALPLVLDTAPVKSEGTLNGASINFAEPPENIYALGLVGLLLALLYFLKKGKGVSR